MKEQQTCCEPFWTKLSVINRQYQSYINLDTADEELQRKTESARLHNIDAEEVMGMFSAAQDKAKHATVCFTSAKLRGIKNKTMQYLDNMDKTDREKRVKWAIKAARMKRERNKRSNCDVLEEMIGRMKEKQQQQDDKERRKHERELMKMKVQDLPAKYQHLEEQELSDLTEVMSGNIIGRHICHRWNEKEKQELVTYFGKVERMEVCKGKETYVVAYWTPKAETYDDAKEYDMSKLSLAADVVTGDLVLSQMT